MNPIFKRIVSLLLVMAMVIIPIPAKATEESSSAALSTGDLAEKPGYVVTTTLTVEGVPNANTVSIAVDSNLSLDPVNAQWHLEGGLLSDFDSQKNIAVWTTDAEEGVDMNGDVATLAFTIPNPAADEEVVSCVINFYDMENNLLDSLSAQVTVDVLHAPAQSISISEDALTLDLAGTTSASLSASILPEDSTDSFVWYSEDEEIATVDENGNVTAHKVGETNIVAQSVSSQIGGSTVSASCAVTVTCSHNMEHYLCTLCGYSEASEECVAYVESPYGGNYYFTSLKEAVEFAHTIPREERPPVYAESECIIDETIVISENVSIFCPHNGEHTTVKVSADTAFELTDRAYLLINNLNIETTGSYIFKITDNGNGVQMSDTNLSGATKSAFYVPEGVERNGIQFYGGSISAYTAITMNGSEGGFTIAGNAPSISVSNPDGAFILNGNDYTGQLFSAAVTNSAENGAAFTISNNSNIVLGGVNFNGENYWNAHGAVMPNNGAAARTDITYYTSAYAAIAAAENVIYIDGNGNEIYDSSVPVTLFDRLSTAENLTLNARYPIDLYVHGEAPQILLEKGAVLDVKQVTRLHGVNIFVQNGATIIGAEKLDLTDNSSILYESEIDANEDLVAKVPYHDGTYLYFESLNEAIDTVMAVTKDARPPIMILRDCVLTETVTLDSDLFIIPNAPSGDITADDVVAYTISAGEGVKTMFNIGGDCFLTVNFTRFDAQGANYIFNITSSDANLLLSAVNATGAAKAAIHTARTVRYTSVLNGDNATDPYAWSANIQLYGCEVEGDTAITLEGSGSHVIMAGMNGVQLTGTGSKGAVVINGDDHVVAAMMANLYADNIAFTMKGDSIFMGTTYNNYSYHPGDEDPSKRSIPNNGAVAQMDHFYFGSLQDACDFLSSITDVVEDPDFSLHFQLLEDVSVSDAFVMNEALYPVYLHMNGHVITLESGAEFNVNNELHLIDGSIYVENGAQIIGQDSIFGDAQIEHEQVTDPVAMIGDAAYSSLENALHVAKAGDTVTLNADDEIETLQISTGIHLDLNGYTLTAEFASIYKGAHIIDNSKTNSGLLVVDPDYIMINTNNSALPIWTGEGYIFVNIIKFNETWREQNGKPEYVFQPIFETVAHQYLLQGAAESGVKIAIRMTWTNETGTAYQDYIYFDATVFNVINSYVPTTGKYRKAFNAIINDSTKAKFALTVVLISDTGVELQCS